MSYLIDTNYYAYIHNVVHFYVLNELQLFHFASFSIRHRPRHTVDDSNERQLILNIHKYLMYHPVNNKIKVSNFVLDRLTDFKLYCINIHHIGQDYFIIKLNIFCMIKHYNKNARHMKNI